MARDRIVHSLIHSRSILAATFIVLLVGGMVPAAAAAVFPKYPTMLIVTRLTDDYDGYCNSDCSLREAVNNASAGDAIRFAPGLSGMLTLTSVIPIATDLSITGNPTTISGGFSVSFFHIFPDVTARLENLTLLNGAAPFGGAILNEGTLNVIGCSFVGNVVTTGGGGAVTNTGVLSISNGQFIDNEASGSDGGAIYNLGKANLQNVSFLGNRGMYGGAIYSKGTLNISGSEFDSNVAQGSGGGIFSFYPQATATISDSIFQGNSAGVSGGGLHLEGYSATLTRLTVENNTAVQMGGGIALYNYNSSSLTESLIHGNQVTHGTFDGYGYGGGGLIIRNNATISNTTIQGNQSPATGGGIGFYSYYSITVELINTTIAENSALYASDPYQDGGGNVYIVESSLQHIIVKNTIIANPASGRNCASRTLLTLASSTNSVQYPGSDCGTIITSGDPKLGPLQNNNGPTLTMALGPGSAALDTGNASICSAAPVNNRDQRGFTRPGGTACDMGAYEAAALIPTVTPFPSPTPPASATLTLTPSPTPAASQSATATITGTPSRTPYPAGRLVTKLADTNDGICDYADCSLREAIAAAPPESEVTFAPGLSGTILLNSPLEVDKGLGIIGPTNATIIIDASQSETAFHVTAEVAIEWLTIANSTSVLTTNPAAALQNEGHLQLLNMTFLHNRLAIISSNSLQIYSSSFIENVGPHLQNYVNGAIRAGGFLSVKDSYFRDNGTVAGGAPGSTIQAGGTLRISRSLFVTTMPEMGVDLFLGTQDVLVGSTTFTGIKAFATIEVSDLLSSLDFYPSFNNVTFAGVNYPIYRGILVLRNTVLLGVPGSETTLCRDFAPIDGGHNMQYPGTSCGSSIPSQDPMLGSLANNGGPLESIAPLSGSPLIDAGNNAVCQLPVVSGMDQRGAPRLVDGDSNGSLICDIGAVEVNAAVPTQTPSPTPISTPKSPQPDTIGVYRTSSGTFYLRNSNTTGSADITAAIQYATATDLPVTGDWNGDGIDTVGVYRTTTGFFYLWDANATQSMATPVYSVLLGNPGDTPFAGRWTADMNHDGLGVYRNSNGILYLKKQLTGGFSDFAAVLGNPGDSGFAGDWDGDGFDSPGVFRPSNAQFYLSNNSMPNGITYSDINFVYGAAADLPVAGDWIGQGHPGVGMYRGSNSLFYLRNQLSSGPTDNAFVFGSAGDKPVAGKWIASSQPPNALSVMQPSTPRPVSTDNNGGGE